MIDQDKAHKLAHTDDIEELHEFIRVANVRAYFEALLFFYAGYMERPVSSLDEVRMFIKFIIESSEFDDEIAEQIKNDKLTDVLEIAEKSINKDFVSQSGLEEQEFLIKCMNEYEKEREE